MVACSAGDPDLIPGNQMGRFFHGEGRPHGEGNGNTLSILAWIIPWIEETGRLQSMGLQRVGHYFLSR